jgi:hypothetical protein
VLSTVLSTPLLAVLITVSSAEQANVISPDG